MVGAIATGDGSIETFPDADVDDPVSITVGPGDTHLWFTSAGNDAIGRIDPLTEQIETFADPSGAVDSPSAITLGPDGDLWFSTNVSRGIGRVDGTTGAVTFLVDQTGQRYSSLAPGGDGEVWAVNINRLTRVDPDTGDLDTYVLPAVGFDPDVDVHEPRLVNDADGRLWATRYGQFSQVEVGTPGETDTTDPTVILRSPVDGGVYLPTETVVADYECSDDAGPTVDCQAGHLSRFPVADGEELEIFPTRTGRFTAFGRDAAGNTSWITNEYWVDAVCHGRRATVYSIYRGEGWGRPGPGPDVVVGDYYAWGHGGDDLLCSAGAGDGHRGDDQLFGRSGPNRLNGGPGRDRLVGGAGADELDGGSGFDVCIGGRGADTFVNCERVRQE